MVGPLRDALKSHAIGRSLAHACARLGILRKGASEEFAKPAGAVCEANEHMQKNSNEDCKGAWLRSLSSARVTKDVTSDTQKYTAWDFVEWAEQHDMKVFLDEL